MRVRYLGHSAFEIRGSRTVYVDPFLTGNPKAPIGLDDVREADLVLVSHDHEDHLGDAAAICKKTGATFVSTYEIACDQAAKAGISVEGMNIGGGIDLPGGVRVNLVQAFHTSSIADPAGIVLEMDGKVIYHLGDTGLFGDMALFAQLWSFDLALVPIGDRFTMGPRMAAKAVEFLRPKKVVPMHYDTFPVIRQDPKRFVELVGGRSQVVVLAPGQGLEL